MKKLKPTSQYKKDYKRYRNNPTKVKKLFDILELLRLEKPIPEENRPHPEYLMNDISTEITHHHFIMLNFNEL